MTIDLICQSYLWILSIYHVLSGAISFLSPKYAMSLYRTVYDCNPVERRHLAIILKPWGALSAFAGVVGLFAAVNPHRYFGVVVGLASLLAARIVYRVWCHRELRAISGIAPHRNVISIVVIAVGFTVLATWLSVQSP